VVLPQTAHLVVKHETLLAEVALLGSGVVLRPGLGGISTGQSQRQ
jgi:hypothetical protein